MSELTTHEVLVIARNSISDEKDWCGDGAGEPGVTRCAAIAIGDAVRDDDDHCVQYLRVCCLLGDFVGAPSGSVALGRWNDSHSHAEVLAAFDKAIAATAPKPDLSFLKDVRVEPEQVA